MLKARGAQAVLYVENALPYLIPPAYAGGIFLSSVFAGAVQALPPSARLYAVGAAAVAALAPLPLIAWKRTWQTSFTDALKRLDRNIADSNLPAQMLGSRQHTGSKDAWESYRERLLIGKVEQFRIGWPQSEIPHYVIAGGFAIATSLCASAYLAGTEGSARLREAFNFHATFIAPPPPDVRAWITSPDGIRNAEPLYLSQSDAGQGTAGAVHKESMLHLAVLDGMATITVDGQPVTVEKEIAGANNHKTTQYKPVKFSTDGLHIVRILNGPTWVIRVEPDLPPEVVITRAGSDGDRHLGLYCIAKDDYGIDKGTINMNVTGANPEATPPPQARLPSLSVPGATLCQPTR